MKLRRKAEGSLVGVTNCLGLILLNVLARFCTINLYIYRELFGLGLAFKGVHVWKRFVR